METAISSHQQTVKERFDALDSETQAAGGVLTVYMQDLRDRVGAGKLGRYVVESIEDALKQRGLGHSGLVLDQWHEVRIWKKGTRLGTFIEAALEPGKTQDEKLREIADSQADEILKQIRSLACV